MSTRDQERRLARLGAAIRSARERAGWTQEELGVKVKEYIGDGVDVGQSAVSNWENGHQQPRPPKLRALEAILPGLESGQLHRILGSAPPPRPGPGLDRQSELTQIRDDVVRLLDRLQLLAEEEESSQRSLDRKAQ